MIVPFLISGWLDRSICRNDSRSIDARVAICFILRWREEHIREFAACAYEMKLNVSFAVVFRDVTQRSGSVA